jgi:hypothetical protein
MRKIAAACAVLAAAASLPLGAASERIDYEAINKIKQQGLNAATSQVMEIASWPLTHHTNLDSYERLQPTDMMRNATIAAAFAYLTANRDEKLPRKPFPAAPPAGRGSGQ